MLVFRDVSTLNCQVVCSGHLKLFGQLVENKWFNVTFNNFTVFNLNQVSTMYTIILIRDSCVLRSYTGISLLCLLIMFVCELSQNNSMLTLMFTI